MVKNMPEDKEEYTAEDYEKEKEKIAKDAWKEFIGEKEAKKIPIKDFKNYNEAREDLRVLEYEWSRLKDNETSNIAINLKRLYGMDGTHGLSRLIKIEMGRTSYSMIKGAKDVNPFIESSQDLWISLNIKIRDCLETIDRLFALSRGFVGFIKKQRELIIRLKEKEEEKPKEPEEKPEPPLSEEEKERFMKELHKRIEEYNEAYKKGDYDLSWRMKGKVMTLAGKSKQKKQISYEEFDKRKIGDLKDLKKQEQQ